MSSISQLAESSGAASFSIPPEPVWPVSVARYHQMIQSGVLTDEDHVELLEGWIVPKMPKHPPHCYVVDTLIDLLLRLNLVGYFVRSQNPITTTDSEPEPDVCVVRGARRDYIDRHPGPHESALVIEVADSSVSRDRGLKKRIYARAGVPVYWIVNLEERQVEVYSQPVEIGGKLDYSPATIYGSTDEIPVILDQKEMGLLKVSDFLAA